MTNKPDNGLSDRSPSVWPEPDAADEMVKYGITRVPVDYFHLGGFRYTSLKDALAQARKQRQI